MDGTAKLLADILRFVLADGEDFDTGDAEGVKRAFALALRHDLGHLVIEALEEMGKMPVFVERCRKVKLAAIYRAAQRQYEYGRMCAEFESARLPFLPLKGAVLCRLYPETWMRTCHDIDVLVRAEDFAAARGVIKKRLGFKFVERTSHDETFRTDSGVYLELHHSLLDRTRDTRAGELLGTVWQHASPVSGGAEHALDAPMFLLLHIAHCAEHFESGGCGIRPFLDLWLWRRSVYPGCTGMPEECGAVLSEAGLLYFAKAAFALADFFLGGIEPDAEAERFLDYITRGGVYGTLENRVAVGEAKRGGRGYIMSRLFLPYERLKNIYPVLKKHPYLMPVMQVRRWFHGLFKGKLWQYKKELKLSGAEDDASLAEMSALRSYLGI